MTDNVPRNWDATKLTPQTGKKVIITGANSGIGYFTALELARHGADVVLACRSEDKGKAAVKTIEAELKLSPGAGRVEFRKLDVSSLASVKQFSDDYKETNDRIDLLINNAGIMGVPYTLTADGIESQFATNHLGHFALTAQLLNLLKNSASARVVSISSLLHRDAKMDLNEIVFTEKNYSKMLAYNNSKLYNLLFTLELNRQLQAHGVKNVIATAAHPGLSATNLAGPMVENASWWTRPFIKLLLLLPLFQSSEAGAWPTLYAAAGANVVANDYFGPDGTGQRTGHPTKEVSQNVSTSITHAQALWKESERLAKLQYQF